MYHISLRAIYSGDQKYALTITTRKKGEGLAEAVQRILQKKHRASFSGSLPDDGQILCTIGQLLQPSKYDNGSMCISCRMRLDVQVISHAK